MVSLRRRRRTKASSSNQSSNSHTVGTSTIKQPKEGHDSAWLLDPSLEQEQEESMQMSEFLQSYLLKCRFSHRAARQNQNGAFPQGPIVAKSKQQQPQVAQVNVMITTTTPPVATSTAITTAASQMQSGHQVQQPVNVTTVAITKMINSRTLQPSSLRHVHDKQPFHHRHGPAKLSSAPSTRSLPQLPMPPQPGHASYGEGDQDRARLFWIHSTNFYCDIPKVITIPNGSPKTRSERSGATRDAGCGDNHDDDEISEVSVELGLESSMSERPSKTPKKASVPRAKSMIDDMWPCNQSISTSTSTPRSSNAKKDPSSTPRELETPQTLEEIDPPPRVDGSSPSFDRFNGNRKPGRNKAQVLDDDEDSVSVRWPSDEDCSVGKAGDPPAKTSPGFGAAGNTLASTTQRLANSAANFFFANHFECGGGLQYCTATEAEALASRDDQETVELNDEDDAGGRENELIDEDERAAVIVPVLTKSDDFSVESSRAMSIGSSWTSYEASGQPLLYDFHYYRSLRNCHDPHIITRLDPKMHKRGLEPLRQFEPVPEHVSFS